MSRYTDRLNLKNAVPVLANTCINQFASFLHYFTLYKEIELSSAMQRKCFCFFVSYSYCTKSSSECHHRCGSRPRYTRWSGHQTLAYSHDLRTQCAHPQGLHTYLCPCCSSAQRSLVMTMTTLSCLVCVLYIIRCNQIFN